MMATEEAHVTAVRCTPHPSGEILGASQNDIALGVPTNRFNAAVGAFEKVEEVEVGVGVRAPDRERTIEASGGKEGAVGVERERGDAVGVGGGEG
jgi:hypothetical protein